MAESSAEQKQALNPPAPSNDGSSQNGDAEKAPVKKEAHLDDFILLGRYTIILCVFAEFMILCQLGNMFYMMYAGAEPPLKSCGSHVFDSALDLKSRCKELASIQNRTKCTPQFSPQFESVNYEWGYYCSSNKWVKQSVSVQMIGVIIGSVVFGQLSDAYGRKPAMLVALGGIITFMIGSSFIGDSLLLFTIVRLIVNIFNGGCIAVQLVFSVENLPKKNRFAITNLITWSPNIPLFALIAYISGDWRTLTRASAVLAVPAALVLMFLSESPRFLVQRRQIDKAKAVIQRMHRIDGRVLDEELLDSVLQRELAQAMELQAKSKRYTYYHLFYTKQLARYTIAIGFSLLTTSLLTYSLLFNMEKLSGSIYMNSVIMGLFRYALNLITAFADLRFTWLGRKLVHSFAEGMAMLALLFFIAVYMLGLQLQLRMVASLAVLSVMGQTTLMYCTNGMLSSELFPTGIRNISFSFGQVLSRVGVVLAPQIFFLSDFWTPLPYIALFVCALVDFIFFHFNVRETKGQPMKSHMPRKEESWFHRNKNVATNKEEPTELLPIADMEGNPVAEANEKTT